MAKMKVVQVPKAGADFELRRKYSRPGLVRINERRTMRRHRWLGRLNMSSQTYLRIIDPCLAASVSRSYYTALELMGDTDRAVALVVEGIESLDPENVTGETLRDAVVAVLVRAQMMPEHYRK